MKLQGRDLSLDMQGEDVQLLRFELALLGYSLPQPAGAQPALIHRFDENVQQAVLDIQGKNGLAETGVVDAATARAINAGVDRQFGFAVRGQVTRADGKPAAQLTVKASDRDMRGEELLGETQTNLFGQYEIRYHYWKYLDAEAGWADARPDLVVRVYAENGAEPLVSSGILFNAGREETVDLLIPPAAAWSEYEQYVTQLERVTQDVSLDELTEEDINFLTGDARIERQRIAWLAESACAARDLHRYELDAPARLVMLPVLYGWFRQGVATNFRGMLERPTDTLITELLKAVDSNILPGYLKDRQDTIRQYITRIKEDLLREPAPAGEVAGLGDWLQLALPGDQDRQRTFVRLYSDHATPDDKFWDTLAEQPEFKDDQSVVKRLRTTLELGALTGNFVPLVETLQNRMEGKLAAGRLRTLAELREADWLEITAAAGVPEGLPGENPEERIKTYASLLRETVESRYPTATFHYRLMQDETPDGPFQSSKTDFQRFFEKNPEFEFGRIPIDQYLDNNQEEKLEGVQTPDVLTEQLSAVQRVFKITPKYRHIRTLLADGLHAALPIIGMGKQPFIEKYRERFGGETEVAEAFDKAAHIYTLTLMLYGRYGAGLQSPMPYVISGNLTKTADASPKWRDMFGSLDWCTCEHCQSVYSPAAYFVDLLQFLKGGPSKNGKTPCDVLLSRRPDLEHIELNCENTHTEIPYVDLVNEVLEEAIAPSNPKLSRQTRGDAQTLKAQPEFVNVAAYQTLADSTDHPSLPFNLWVEEVRLYLQHLGVPRHAVMESFFKGNASGIWKDQAIAREYLNLTELEAGVITGSKPQAIPAFSTGDEGVEQFLQKTGLRYAELLELLDTWFVNPLQPGDFLYTAYDPEIEAASANYGYQKEGIGGYVLEQPRTGAVPLYRLHHAQAGQHFCTSDEAEKDHAIQVLAFKEEGIVGYIFKNPEPGAVPLQRFLHPDGSYHFYTIHGGEKNIAIHRMGFTPQKTEGYLYPQPVPGAIPLYRLAAPDVGRKRKLSLVALEKDAKGRPVDPATCDLKKLKIQGLDATAWQKVHRFTRLRKKLEWPARQLDQAIGAFHTGDIDEPLLLQLSLLMRLHRETDVPVLRLFGWWNNLDTTAYHNFQADGRPEIKSLYDQLFLNEALQNPVEEAFRLSEPLRGALRHPDKTIDTHVPAILAALRITAAELTDIRRDCGLNAPSATLTLDRLSHLWRMASMARALQLSVREFLTLKALLGIDPSESPEKTLRMVEMARKVRQSKFSLAQLRFIYGADGFDLPEVAWPRARVLALGKTVRDELWRIAADGKQHLYQVLSEATSLPAPVTERLLSALLKSAANPKKQLVEDFSALGDPGLGNDYFDISAWKEAGTPKLEDNFKTIVEHFESSCVLLQKAGMLINGFAIHDTELDWLAGHPGDLAGTDPADATITEPFDLNRLRLTPGSFRSKPALFHQWERLYDLFSLRDRHKQEDAPFFDLFGLQALDAGGEQLLASVTRWDKKITGDLIQGFSLSPAHFKNEIWPGRLQRCMDVCLRLGIEIPALFALAATEPGEKQAQSVKNAVKAKYDEQQWPAIAGPLRDELREKQRAALVAWHVAQKGLDDPNDLYDDFLLDVEMSPCMKTSRLKQAIGSVQLFVQRCLMNLEPGVTLRPEEAREWNQWRKQYRVWEANRKVFLYPENWIEPELRDDKSPFFKELESELLQNELTAETAETAFRHYLDKLEQVARLEIVGMYHEKEAGVDIMHVFGRTYSVPHIYFYRKLEKNTWTAWERVDLDIEGDHLIPVVWNRRLYLFWPVFTEQQDARNNKYWEIKLARSRKQERNWNPKKVSSILSEDEHIYKLENKNFSQSFVFKARGDNELNINLYSAREVAPTPSQPISHLNDSDEAWENTTDLTFINGVVYDAANFNQGIPGVLLKVYSDSWGETPQDGDIFKGLNDFFSGKPPLYNAAEKLDFNVRTDNSGFFRIFIPTGGKTRKVDILVEPDNLEYQGGPIHLTINVDKEHYYRRNFPFRSNPSAKKLSNRPVSFDFLGNILLAHNDDLILKKGGVGETFTTIPGTFANNMQLVENEGEFPFIPSGVSTPILRSTPGTFQVLVPSNKTNFTPKSPFIYQDVNSIFFCSIIEDTLSFATHYHANIPDFIRALNNKGCAGLFNFNNQFFKKSDHFYTTDADEANHTANQLGYLNEGVACYIFTNQQPDTIPFLRLFQGGTGDHFYTTSSPEKDFAIKSAGYEYEGIAGYVFGAPRSGMVPFYRLFNPAIGDHFYTTDTGEREAAVTTFGYVEEGICCYVADKPASGMSPFFRLSASQLKFEQKYQPDPLTFITRDCPEEKVDFENGAAFANYNWEIFFHIPFLIAVKLGQNQRFEEAQQWFHYIFDPTSSRAGGPERFWNVKPFYEESKKGILTLEELTQDAQSLEKQIRQWEDNPFNPHAVARLRIVAYMKTVVMKYIENLLEWGDQLFRRETIEAINEATQLYILAAQILGKRPENIPPRAKPEAQSFSSLTTGGKKLNPLGNAWVNIEKFIFPSGPTGASVNAGAASLNNMWFFCLPKNDKLLSYWGTVADRLFKIRHCMNIEGVVRQLPLFEPPIDPALLVRAAAAGIAISDAINNANAPLPHYRFNVMLQKAVELCNDLKALSGALLAALEKRDAEEMSLLRSRHEIAMLKQIKEVKTKQVEDAKESLVVLRKTRAVTLFRYIFYQKLLGGSEVEIPDEGSNIPEVSTNLNISPSGSLRDTERGLGMIQTEQDQLARMTEAQWFSSFAGAANISASIAYLVKANVDAVSEYIPEAFGEHANAIASSFNALSSYSSAWATRDAIMAGYQRRRAEWVLQINTAGKELEQIDKQILAAEIRVAIAEQELKNHELQIENAREVDDFMRDKYTNRELYDWMAGQLSGVYFQSYKMAFDLAKRAEQAFRHELGLEDSNFIQFGYWDSLKKGLLAGEKLHHDLKRMELAYLDQNRREYELTKHVSILQIDPVALVQLRTTGKCTVSLPEEIFDLDCPGHYLRRIKSVALSIPCVAGPYTSVNCTLTLLKSAVRKNAGLKDGNYRLDNGQEDDRFSHQYGAIQSIVTSSAQNDSGLFETNLRDERYLPFEGAGVISEWHLELPPTELQQFNYDTIADVILHLRYTAREGGSHFREKAVAHLDNMITKSQAAGMDRLFSIRHEFPTAWTAFKTGTSRAMTLEFKQEHFPFWSQKHLGEIEGVQLFAKTGEKTLKFSENNEIGEPIKDNAGEIVYETLEQNRQSKGLLTGKLKQLPAPEIGKLFTLNFHSNNIEELWMVLSWGKGNTDNQ